MIADDRWKITIHGGFALVFEGDRDNTGIATRMIVGPYVKEDEHRDYLRHEMVLRVPSEALEGTTTPRGVAAGANHIFVLKGDVKLNAEATGTIERIITADRPATWNNFYWVYDADRFQDRKGTKRTRLRRDWPNKLVARLDLRDGTLKVLAPRYAGVYAMSANNVDVEQPLATHIEYTPHSVTGNVVFSTDDGGKIVARPKLPDGRPTCFDVAAECGCWDEPPVGEIRGFEVTFGLYAEEPPRFLPRFNGFTPPPASKEPSSDCPPRAYSI